MLMPTPEKLVIATRASRLALWQAEHVRTLLEQRYPSCDVSLLEMTTRGDQILDRTLSKVGGKGLFVKELENALLDGRADLAVHSLKDVPVDLTHPFALTTILERDDPLDAFVSNEYASLAEMPAGATHGVEQVGAQFVHHLLKVRFGQSPQVRRRAYAVQQRRVGAGQRNVGKRLLHWLGA
jgi:hydroxymethylbilane synthase